MHPTIYNKRTRGKQTESIHTIQLKLLEISQMQNNT